MALRASLQLAWIAVGTGSSAPSFEVAIAPCGAPAGAPPPHIPAKSPGTDKGTVSQFWLSTAPAGQLVNASQPTEAGICYTEAGIQVDLSAVERHVFSSADVCQSPVWEHGNAMEVFLAPVRGRWDVPAQYFEVDGAPSGAVWGGCIEAEAFCPGCANVTDSICSQRGEFVCEGDALGAFTNGVFGVSELAEDGWDFAIFLPWSIFAEWARPTAARTGELIPWRHWRLNFYRYNFFQGTGPDDFELDAWSPTHAPSFHDPRRFGHGCMGPPGLRESGLETKKVGTSKEPPRH